MSAARRKRKPVEAEEKKKRMPTTRYTPDYRKGLTSQQVQEHKLHGWTNQAVDSTSKTTKEIVQENVFTYFNLIFLVLAVLLCPGGGVQGSDISSGDHCQYADRNYSGNPGEKGTG